MSNIFVGKTLAAGQLSNTITTIYQSPAANITYTKGLNLFNNSSASQNIALYKNLGGNVYPWYVLTLNPNESADILEEPLVLSASDSIQGNSNTANAIIFTVTGVQEQ